MIRLLPDHNITFIKIARVTSQGADGSDEVISASRVRKLLKEQGVTDEVLALVPDCTAEYLKTDYKQD
jgi:[citrate (pro-3S)-lyase] ligase